MLRTLHVLCSRGGVWAQTQCSKLGEAFALGSDSLLMTVCMLAGSLIDTITSPSPFSPTHSAFGGDSLFVMRLTQCFT